METIKNYLDNMFKALPKTSELSKLKSDLLCNMEDKYNDLKASGKSENEAIGIVISEFGNIDEIIEELDIKINSDDNFNNTNNINNDSKFNIITLEDCTEFLKEKKKASRLVGIGVFLCIISGAFSALISGLFEKNLSLVGTMSIAPVFVLVVIAIGLFIYANSRLQKYDFIKNGKFNLSNETENYIDSEYKTLKNNSTRAKIISISLFVISPLCVIIAETISETFENTFGPFFLLLLVAIGVFILINVSGTIDGCKMLLKINDYSIKSRKKNKTISAVSSIVWPIAVCIFLFSGFVFDLWHIAWIVFPITVLLFAAFSGAYNIIKDK
ncbi:permease prefix domain 1-containing protein [Clostridium sp. Ade.TY]|uniref:permease prefix domain 1-containing protein n=1 Tax=Clostridium sp. Ade.TY TaxID=1391647 RepID=UPI0003FFB6C4|nr:permease prefix domain 1-containing protein [Clostridium sp. Ade.TY]